MKTYDIVSSEVDRQGLRLLFLQKITELMTY